jgi:hypothetical protein
MCGRLIQERKTRKNTILNSIEFVIFIKNKAKNRKAPKLNGKAIRNILEWLTTNASFKFFQPRTLWWKIKYNPNAKINVICCATNK